MTLRGAIFPEANSVGVPTGAQPPPPIASMKPATVASGINRKPGTILKSGRRSGMVRNRHTTKMPRASSTMDITGAAAAPERVST